MANTITLYDTIPGRIMGMGPIQVYKCAYDGTAGLEVIRTPDSTSNRIFVTQITFADDTAGTITLASADTAVLPLILTTYQALIDKSDIGWIFNTLAGEALKVSTTQNMTIYIATVEGTGRDINI